MIKFLKIYYAKVFGYAAILMMLLGLVHAFYITIPGADWIFAVFLEIGLWAVMIDVFARRRVK